MSATEELRILARTFRSKERAAEAQMRRLLKDVAAAEAEANTWMLAAMQLEEEASKLEPKAQP